MILFDLYNNISMHYGVSSITGITIVFYVTFVYYCKNLIYDTVVFAW